VAHKAYGAPVFWRALAAVNGIDDPMRVPVGTVLLVPDRGEIKGLS
jgi:nucleoid-associated protein YgaU